MIPLLLSLMAAQDAPVGLSGEPPPNPAPVVPFDPAPWAAATTPAAGSAAAIGGFSEGCLRGARGLAEHGTGFQLMRPSRGRRFGHPELVAFVRRFAAAAHGKNLGPVMVADLSQPRGGPAPTGHASHQSGLDVDLWYVAPAAAGRRRLTRQERDAARPEAVVELSSRALTPLWHPRIAEMLRLAAEDPAVDRIFVHARVKKALCDGGERGAPWLAKLRPWWGHHDHFHVRLRCPASSPLCQPQPPIESGSGCGAKLEWWFSPDAWATHQKRKDEASAAQAKRSLPHACAEVLHAPPARTARRSSAVEAP